MKSYLAYVLVLFLLAVPVYSAGSLTAAEANQKVFRKVTPEDNARATALLEEANGLRKAGNYSQALKLYTKAIHLNERLGGYAGRAMCHYLLGNYELAERDANTSIHQRKAKDLMLPGMMGMAEYVRGLCRYRRGEYESAEADLKTASASRYGTDELRRIYLDCVQRAGAAREKASLDNIRGLHRNVESVVVQALQEGKLKAYDVSRGTFAWRSEADRADFEKTMFGCSQADGSAALQSITKYLWQKHINGAEVDEVVAFVPRHTIIADEYYHDKVLLVTLTPVPPSITQVADLPPATRLIDNHVVENGGLSEIRHSNNSEGKYEGYTWESLGQEVIRQNEETELGVKIVPGLPDDYIIIPTSEPGIYKLRGKYGGNAYELGAPPAEGWLRRIDVPLPPLP